MRLDEHSGNTYRDRGAGEHWHEAPLTSARRALPSRLLHRVRCVEDHRCSHLDEDRQRAHVRNERVVAEGDAAFGHQHIWVAGTNDLGHDILHVPWRKELTLFDVDYFARAARRQKKVGLAAKESRDLQDIDRRRHRGALIALMHVGGDGETGGFLDLGKNWKRLFQSESPRASQARSVRLVERALIDKSDAETAGDLPEGVRSFKCMRPALQHARPGNHRERQTIAKTGASRRDNRAWRGAQGCRHGRTMGREARGVNWGATGFRARFASIPADLAHTAERRL